MLHWPRCAIRQGDTLCSAGDAVSRMSKSADYLSTPYRQRNPMRRHWCITLWLMPDGERITDLGGVLDCDPLVTSIIDTARLTRAHYVAWGLEDKRRGGGGEPPSATAEERAEDDEETGADAGLHFHVYVECERSVRWTTIRNKFQIAFPGAHVEPRGGWRTSAREYALGLRSGLPKPEAIIHGEWGDWREDTPDSQPDDIAAAATALILQGANPQEVASQWPRWFLRHGGGVIRLWETLHRRRWLR